MRNLFKTLAILTLLLAPAAASAQVSFGITIGPPPQWRASRIGPMPGPGYEWIDGYWYPVGSRWTWHAGYWTRPPYAGAYWVQPYYDGRRYVPGYWDSGRGRFDHNHGWDRRRDRDWRKEDRRDRKEERKEDRRDDRRR